MRIGERRGEKRIKEKREDEEGVRDQRWCGVSGDKIMLDPVDVGRQGRKMDVGR